MSFDMPKIIREFCSNGSFVIMLIKLHDKYILVCNDKNEHDDVNRYDMNKEQALKYYNDLVEKYSSN